MENEFELHQDESSFVTAFLPDRSINGIRDNKISHIFVSNDFPFVKRV